MPSLQKYKHVHAQTVNPYADEGSHDKNEWAWICWSDKRVIVSNVIWITHKSPDFPYKRKDVFKYFSTSACIM